MGNFDFVEEKESVVHCVVSKLRANVTNVNILKRLMSLEVSNLYNKWVRSVRFAAHNQLGHDYGIVGGAAERSNPPFACGEMRRVQNERLVFWIPGRCCLEATNIGSVTKLSLGVTTDDLVVVRFG